MKIKRKLSNRKAQLLSGIGFLTIGIYMMFILNDVKGQVPFFLGVGILLWRI